MSENFKVAVLLFYFFALHHPIAWAVTKRTPFSVTLGAVAILFM